MSESERLDREWAAYYGGRCASLLSAASWLRLWDEHNHVGVVGRGGSSLADRMELEAVTYAVLAARSARRGGRHGA